MKERAKEDVDVSWVQLLVTERDAMVAGCLGVDSLRLKGG